MKNFNVYALHIGVDVVDQQFYKNEISDLSGCVNDMHNMAHMIKNKHNGSLKEQVLLYAADGSEENDLLPSSVNISKVLNNWSNELKADDFLIITYAGHGAPVPDQSNDEKDNIDEAWICYDKPLIDDEINALFCKFKEGVKILIISDSCHSGTTTRGVQYNRLKEAEKTNSRYVPFATMKKILALNGVLQNNNNRSSIIDQKDTPQASIKLLAACTDTEFAKEENGEGVFSKNLRQAFNENKYLTYNELIEEVRGQMPIDQTPQITDTGAKDFSFDKATFLESEQGVVQGEANTVIHNKPFKIETSTITVKTKVKGLNITVVNKTKRAAVTDDIPIINNTVNADLLSAKNSWDKAHHLLQAMTDEEANQIEYIEPNVLSNGLSEVDIDGSRGGNNILTTDKYLKTYPDPVESKDENPFIWHLSDQHSQLRKAFLSLHSYNYNLGNIPTNKELATIGHIDTGVLLNHPTLPVNFNFDASDPNVEDVEAKGFAKIGEQQGHGHGTVSILAGNKFEVTNEDGFKGYYGAHPFAHIISYKISETVAIFNAKKFKRAVKKAINDQCDVLTMSMAGLPSKEMAEAVNLAYENGLVLVSAASNSFVKNLGRILPKRTLYPARFDRVIAAVGATYKETPYLFYDQKRNKDSRASGGAYMQMCYGPEEVLNTTLAAYSPNIVWFGSMHSSNTFKYYVKTGGGTSSATPQIAAAAALYIEKYRTELDHMSAGEGNKWKKAEIVRRALFDSAKKIDEHQDKFGNGILRAFDLIHNEEFSPNQIVAKHHLNKNKITAKEACKEANVNGNFLKRLIGVFRSKGSKKNDLSTQMLSTEILQLLHTDEKLHRYLELNFSDLAISDLTKENLIKDIRSSNEASETLKNSFKSLNVVLSKRKSIDDSYTITTNGDEIRLRGENCQFLNCNKNVHTRDFYNTAYEVIDVEGELEILNTRGGKTGIHVETMDALNSSAIAAYIIVEVDGEKAGYWQFGQNENEENRGSALGKEAKADETFINLKKVYELNTVRGKGVLKKVIKFTKRIFKWKKQHKKAIASLVELVIKQQNKLIIYDLKNKRWVEEEETNNLLIWKSIDKRKEICLLFHGLFSSVEKGYTTFFEQPFVNEALQKKFGQYIIGYNTADVVNGVADNARAYYGALKGKLICPKKCVVLTTSRGGIVSRYMFEKLLHNQRGQSVFELKKMIQIAPPNNGTPMANDAMYQKLLNITSILFTKIPVVNFMLNPGIFMLLKHLAGEVTSLPGIDDLEVGSSVLKELNKIEADRSNYHIVISNFEPKRKIFKRLLDELAIDRFVFRKANNDGVVPVRGAKFQMPNGMENGELNSKRLAMKKVNFKIANVADEVNHFEYLENETIQKQVCDWLTV